MNFVGAARPRTALGLELARASIGCEMAALLAVLSVETAGSGFDRKGRPKALFEPHVFYRLLSGRALQQAVKAGLAYERWGTRPYPKDSYPRIEQACWIDEEKALQATSWGLPQILGTNYRAAGYASATDMVLLFAADEDQHLAAMAAFVVKNGLADELRRHDWPGFARGYNGPSYAKHGYHTKLAKAYAYHKARVPMATVVSPLPAPRVPADQLDHVRPVLRKGMRGRYVEELQHELIEEGAPLTVDGVFGPATYAAVRDVQARLGLVVDGVVGAVTWGALRVSTGEEREAA